MSRRVLIICRSGVDSYLTGEKIIEVLEKGLRHWGFHHEDA